MKSELIHTLKTDFPDIFTSDYSLPTCGDGWYSIIYAFCRTAQGHVDSAVRQRDWVIERNQNYATPRPIPDLVPQVRAEQLKEKFGTLRIYFTGGDAYVSGAAQVSERLSAYHCELCGKLGALRNSTWIQTLCDECNKNDKN